MLDGGQDRIEAAMWAAGCCPACLVLSVAVVGLLLAAGDEPGAEVDFDSDGRLAVSCTLQSRVLSRLSGLLAGAR